MKYETGNRLRYFRERRGLSQKDLAEKIGVSNGRISNWEQGINRPDVDILASLCQSLDVSADELLGIKLPDTKLTAKERLLIIQYRKRPELQQAVNILLGLD